MQLSVDPIQRYAKMRAHTATHLLHAQLAAIFPQTKQAGSLVDEDYLRFDFYADNLLTNEQIETIETNINSIIKQALSVTTEEMSYKDATKSGAKAFFEDKYGDTVRVVTMGSVILNEAKRNEGSRTKHLDSSFRLPTGQAGSEWQISIELCGWTHVTNTKDIGAFTIISQEAVASGIKRITAVTWPKTIEIIHEQRKNIDDIAQVYSVPVKQLLPKIKKEYAIYEKLQKDYPQLQHNLITVTLQAIKPQKKEIGNTIHITPDSPLAAQALKNIAIIAKDILPTDTILVTDDGSFAIISPSSEAKSIAQQYNLKGGWSDMLFQGKDPKILDIFKRW